MKKSNITESGIASDLSRDTLRNLALFSELTIEQLRQVASVSKIQKFKKNEIIFSEGDLYKGFYIPLKGSVKIFKCSLYGKESIIHLIKPYDAFGDLPLFEGGNYPVNALTTSDSTLLFISKEEFLKLISSNSSICFQMLVGFAKRLRTLTGRIEDMTTKEVTNRLAKYLVEEIKKSKTEKLTEPFVKLSVSKRNIASYLGTITETLSRSLKKLHADQIIRTSGKTVFVKNFKRLKELAE
ncbi:MAG: Crp/Fnr family transcriptional regulator [Bacteroidota bacterium]